MTKGRYLNLFTDSRGTTANLTRGTTDTVSTVTKHWVFGNGWLADAEASSTATAALTTQVKLAAAPAAVASNPSVALTARMPIGTATASCAASVTTARLSSPVWQQVGSGAYNNGVPVVELTDTLFYSPYWNEVGVLVGSTMTWYAQSAFPNGRVFAGVCALSATTVLAYGGSVSNVDDTAIAEAYIGTISGTTISWAAATTGPITKRLPNLVKLSDGRILIANGANPPINPSFSYDTIFATVSGTTITYATWLQGAGSGWFSWQKSVVLSDGRILSITPYSTGAANYSPQFNITTISGNTFSVVTANSNITRAGTSPTGWFHPGLCMLSDGRVLIGGGYWHDGVDWQNDPNIYSVSVTGNSVALSLHGAMPYTVPGGSYAGTTMFGLSPLSLYVGADSTTYGEFVTSLSNNIEIAAAVTAASTTNATLAVPYSPNIAGSISAASIVTAALTAGPMWTSTGGGGENLAYGVLSFSTTKFFNPLTEKVGTMSGGVMTWNATNLPDATYTLGHSYCILDSTHILCVGGANTANTISTTGCWVGTLSGSTITWASAGNLNATRGYSQVVKLSDGRVLVNAGYANGYVGAKTDSEFLTLTAYSITGAVTYAAGGNQYITTNRLITLPDGRLMWDWDTVTADAVQYRILTVSGNTFSGVTSTVSYPGGGYGHGGVALVLMASGRIFFGAGHSKLSPYSPITDIYEMTVSGTTLTRSVNPVSQTPGGDVDSVVSMMLEGPSGDLMYHANATTPIYSRATPASFGITLSAAVTAQATASASIHTETANGWTVLGNTLQYSPYGVLAFDTTHFFDINTRQVGVLSGEVMLWYTTNLPNDSYREGMAFTILDATHILASGGTNAALTAGTSSCYVGTLLGNAITWATAGNLNQTRSRHSATLLSDGRVLVNGGYAYDYNTQRTTSEFLTLVSYSVNSINVYASGSEQYITRPTRLSDGRLLWISGSGTNALNCTILTVSGNTYSTVSSSLAYSFGANTALYAPSAMRQSNGRIFLGGGYFDAGGGSYPPCPDIYEIYVVGDTITKSALPVDTVPVTTPNNYPSYLLEGPSNKTAFFAGAGTAGQFMKAIQPAAGSGAALAGALTTLGNTIAPLTTAIRLASAVSATNTYSAALKVGAGLTAAPLAASTITAALSTGQGLAAIPSATVTTTAVLTTGIRLASTPASVAAVMPPALSSGISLAASTVGLATTAGALTTGISLAAASSATGAFTAGLSSGIRLASAVAGLSTVTAPLTTAFNLAAAPASAGATTAALSSGIQLAAAAQAVATRLAADLTVAGGAALMVATPSAVSTITAPLTTQISLAGAVSAVATTAQPLTTQIRLAAAPTDVAVATGVATTQIRLAASSSATAATTAGLVNATHALAATPSATNSFAAALTTQVRLAGAVSSVPAVGSAALSTIIRLAGTPTSISVTNGVLTAQIKLVAASSATPRIDAQLAGTIAAPALVASAVAGSTVGATLTTHIDLAGTGYVAVSATGAITTQIKLAGVLTASALVRGRIDMASLATAKVVRLVALESTILVRQDDTSVFVQGRSTIREIAA